MKTFVVLALCVGALSLGGTRVLAAPADPQPVQLLTDVELGPMLLDPSTTVVVTRVDKVVPGTARPNGDVPSELRLAVVRTLRGKMKAGAAIQLPFVKQMGYRTPTDKSRAFHDQWQELPFASNDLLVWLLRDHEPLAVLPVSSVKQPEIDALDGCVGGAAKLLDRVKKVMPKTDQITSAFVRAALEDKTALARGDKAAVITNALSSPKVDPLGRSTWALYSQGLFVAAKGRDSVNVSLAATLLQVAVTDPTQGVAVTAADLAHQFLIQDYADRPHPPERKQLVRALPKALAGKARTAAARWRKHGETELATELEQLAAVLVAP